MAEKPKRQPRRTSEEAQADPLVAVTFRLPRDVVEAAKRRAAERGESMSSAVATLLRRYSR